MSELQDGMYSRQPSVITYYSIVGGLEHAPIDTLRQVGHSVRLGILAKPRAYLT